MKLDGVWSIEVMSDLVDEPVAVRYGWANWPTGNLVGRERLPMPTFRTDDWPLPEGVNYMKEAEEAAREVIGQLKEQGEKQALDRKIRQMQIDLPQLETELYLRKGRNTKKLVGSKIARLQTILDELQQDDWLRRALEKYPELTEQIEATRQAVEKAKAGADKIEEE